MFFIRTRVFFLLHVAFQRLLNKLNGLIDFKKNCVIFLNYPKVLFMLYVVEIEKGCFKICSFFKLN